MKQRCNNPANRAYSNYGGRGISVCERWNSFENFLADMGEKPDGLTLDRIDVNGNYCPENCRWATWEQQCENKRDPYSMVTYRGESWPIQKLAEHLQVNRYTMYRRMLRGWPEETWGNRPYRKPLGATPRT